MRRLYWFYFSSGVSIAKPYVDTYNSTNDTCRYGLLLGSSFKGIGDICPKGHYCLAGAVQPTPCAPGSYNNDVGQSVCTICPPGYYCPEGTSHFANYSCPTGHYCLRNTTERYQYPCPEGSFNDQTNQIDSTACLPCTQGHFCAGTGNSHTDGECAEGWYCSGSATSEKPTTNGGRCLAGSYCPNGTAIPLECDAGKYCGYDELSTPSGNCSAGFYCIKNSTTATPTDGIVGDECPVGSYCPEGTLGPVACKPGSFLSSKRAQAESYCQPCTAGKFCNDSGLEFPVGDCLPGYYCPSGQNSATAFECTKGHFCEGGKGYEENCPSGTYQDEKNQHDCKVCPAGYFCNATFGPVVNYVPNACPPGYYCSNGTKHSEESPCPIGTFNNITGRTRPEECTQCLGGFYCGQPGLVYPRTMCGAGYFCKSGAKTSTPEEGGNANICPLGHFCPEGTDEPEKCPEGTLGMVTKLEKESECSECPEGKYCGIPGGYNTTTLCQQGFYCPNGSHLATQNECPLGSYCPAGSAVPELCPIGTFSNRTQLYERAQCTDCLAGSYCDQDGLVYPAGECLEGFYCPVASKQRNPVECPIGLHCPTGIL